MVIQFSIGNYRSFNSIQTINFRATSLVSEDKTVDENNIVEVGGQRMLKTLGVYGANGSGKSNLVKGMSFFKDVMHNSLYVNFPLGSTSFKQSNKEPDNLGFFQIVILLDGKKYRYGFTLDANIIASEWLFGPADKNETYYFKRLKNDISINKEFFQEGSDIPYDTKLRANSLFLSFTAAYNGAISGQLVDYFFFKLNLLELDHASLNRTYNNLATNSLTNNGNKEMVLNWLHNAGLDYADIKIENMGEILDEREPIPYDYNEGDVYLYKYIYNEIGQSIGTVNMNLDAESDGTRKYYAFIGKLHDKFENGGLFISDEIDSNFHPSLLKKIIGMFNNPKINKANAQLLFTSHDTNLMSPEIMRRDQFYFTEKSMTDNTVLYALSALKGIRNNADFAKQYLAGFYGAVPMLGNFIEEFVDEINPENEL